MASIVTATKDGGYLHLGYGPENALGKRLGKPILIASDGVSLKVYERVYRISVDGLKAHLRSIGLNEKTSQVFSFNPIECKWALRLSTEMRYTRSYTFKDTPSDAIRIGFPSRLPKAFSGPYPKCR